MCRLAAYLGNPLPLKDFLIAPEHSLYLQSWAPKELRYAKLNADGFGFGWYQDDGAPATYRNPMPIWSDSNLAGLASALERDLWVAMVRSATEGFDNSLQNSQPFCDRGRLYVHNGFVTDFRRSLRHEILKILEPDIAAGIGGLTDSEYLVALIRQCLREAPGDTVADALQKAWRWLRSRGTREAFLNFIVSEADRLFVMRAAVGGPALTMYAHYEAGAHTVASERMTDSAAWEAVPEDSILIAERNRPARVIKL